MKDALDDLSARARRDELTPAEAQHFEQVLQGSAEARLLHDLGRRFDAEDPQPPSADAASEAVVQAALERLQKRGTPLRRSWPRSPWLIAAAAVLAASLAGAVVLGVQRLRSAAPAATSSASGAGTSRVASPGLPRSLPSALPIVPSAEPEAPAMPSASPPVASALPSSAAELLSAAGRARRSGQSAVAVELLQTLRTRFPNSPEASASEITLGKLQLERGAAAAALSHFDGYLHRSPAGALAPEALWGRAQALTQLGRSAEARRSLTELLERYPSSPYTSAARAKLGASEK